MARYHVCFFKAVTTDTGQDVDALQATIDVEAADEKHAVELAKERFCGDRGIGHWRHNADRIEVETRPD